MGIIEGIEDLSAKLRAQKDSIQTEEATKNAFVMPFISRVLGYDVFNPLEVIPEFTADHGMKKGEKVDYAIMKDGEVQILIECKHVGDPLNVKHASQLFRYFSVTNARIGVLTNGQAYHFFTDLDAPNIMDQKPFLVLDLLDIDEIVYPELSKLTKETFNLDSVLNSAEELKYVGALKREIGNEFKEPGKDFVRLLMAKVTERRATADNLSLFTELVGKATKQFLKEKVHERLKNALRDGDTIELPLPGGELTSEQVHKSAESAVEAKEESDKTGVVTTEEELAGYQIVKAIACSEVKPNRVTHRDSKTYFGILLDDNNRRTIARLHFNAKAQKYIGLLDEEKKEIRHPIDELEDIYLFADQIRACVARLNSN